MLLARPGSAPAVSISAGHYLRQTAVITLFNPKAIVFYMAFFPLFIDPARHQGLLTFSVMAQTFLYGLAMTLLTHHLAERMRARSQLGQALERLAGLCLVGFGLKLALSR